MRRAHAPSNARSNASSISTDVTDGRTDGDPTHLGEITHLPNAREVQAGSIAVGARR